MRALDQRANESGRQSAQYWLAASFLPSIRPWSNVSAEERKANWEAVVHDALRRLLELVDEAHAEEEDRDGAAPLREAQRSLCTATRLWKILNAARASGIAATWAM